MNEELKEYIYEKKETLNKKMNEYNLKVSILENEIEDLEKQLQFLRNIQIMSEGEEELECPLCKRKLSYQVIGSQCPFCEKVICTKHDCSYNTCYENH